MFLDDNKDLIRRYTRAIDDNETSDWTILDDYIAEASLRTTPVSRRQSRP